MLTIDEKNACYDADTSLHAHFLCKKCNKIFDLPAPAEDAMVGRMKNDGYQVEELHYYYKGVCPKCMQQDDNLAN